MLLVSSINKGHGMHRSTMIACYERKTIMDSGLGTSHHLKINLITASFTLNILLTHLIFMPMLAWGCGPIFQMRNMSLRKVK